MKKILILWLLFSITKSEAQINKNFNPICPINLTLPMNWSEAKRGNNVFTLGVFTKNENGKNGSILRVYHETVFGLDFKSIKEYDINKEKSILENDGNTKGIINNYIKDYVK